MGYLGGGGGGRRPCALPCVCTHVVPLIQGVLLWEEWVGGWMGGWVGGSVGFVARLTVLIGDGVLGHCVVPVVKVVC